jgi:hypothetical protein
MNPRERVEVALRGGMPDVVPFTVYETMLPKSRVERELRNEGLCIVERKPTFKAVYKEVKVEKIIFTAEDGHERVRTVVRTPVGVLTALDRPAGFTTWHEERLFKSEADYEPLECMIRDRQYLPDYEAFVEAQELLGEDAFVRASIGYSPLQEILYNLMGLEQFAIQWQENRDRLMKLYEALTEDRRKIYPIVAQSPAMAVNYGGNVSPEVMGLERFERYILPHYEEAADILHAHGKLIGVHFDANTRLFAAAIARSKLDYIEAFTPYPDCDMTVAEARQAWPRKVLWINFPSSVHLQPAAEIAAMAQAILKQAAPGQGFLIGITEDVPKHRWQESFRVILRTCNHEGRTPIPVS